MSHHPPNLRYADSCLSCRFSDMDGEKCLCRKFGSHMSYSAICDSFKPRFGEMVPPKGFRMEDA